MTSPMGGQGVVAMLGNIIGSVVGAYGAYEGGVAGQAMQNYRARVAQINAGIAEDRANTAFATGDIQSQIAGVRAGQLGLRSHMASGNIDVGSGSAKDVINSQAETTQFEIGTIRNRAAQEAYGYKVAGFSDTATANLDIAAGQQEKIAGDINAVSSILGGATQVSDKWAKYAQAFPTSAANPDNVGAI